MKISENGINLIKSFEGCCLDAYKCPSGVLTIGYGHTGSDVKTGLKITSQQAEELLKKDLEYFENKINNLLCVQLNQNQYDAIVSFVFNIGVGAFSESTMLKFLNSGCISLAAEQFDRWIYSGGIKLNGLVKRRKAEKELFIR